jgi:hypothetical protein
MFEFISKKIADIKILHEGYTADYFLNRMKTNTLVARHMKEIISRKIESWVLLPFLNPCCGSSIAVSNFSLNLFSITPGKTLLGILHDVISP